jgi:hypothetical protein
MKTNKIGVNSNWEMLGDREGKKEYKHTYMQMLEKTESNEREET